MEQVAPKPIKKAAVMGAGVMGAPIAAILANAGIEVALLDIVPKDAEDRNVIAKSAIQRMAKASLNPDKDPLNGAFMHPDNAKLVKPGNFDDDMEQIADADWIIEVVVENLDIKKSLYEKIDAVRKPGAIVSSNTSTIPLDHLVDGQSDAFKEDFMITHFFNPPRFMRLMEIVGGKQTNPEHLERIKEFGDVHLGKEVVECRDTPGFKGNRIGVFMLLRSIIEAAKQDMRPEEVDAVLGRPVGFEKSGVFGTLDVVGLDTVPKVIESLRKTLPEDDTFHELYEGAESMGLLARLDDMVAQGYTGRKGKGGFFRPKKDENGKTVKRKGKTVLESIDLKTGEYSDVIKPDIPAAKKGKKGLSAVVNSSDQGGELAWNVLRDTLHYAASLIPEISDDMRSVDAAMNTGFKWQNGPFAMIDKLGADVFEARLEAEGKTVPDIIKAAKGRKLYQRQGGSMTQMTLNGTYEPIATKDGVMTLDDVKRNTKPLIKGNSASLWDIGDGVVCLEFHSMLNMIDPSTLLTINNSIKLVENSGGKYKAMVIHNDGKDFSAGANLPFAHLMLKSGMNSVIEGMIYFGQSIFNAMRLAPFPVVGAPQGRAFGGGAEVLLHCDAVQAHAETYMGLVEAGVGFIPGWNGIERYYERAEADPATKGGPFPPVRRTFETILGDTINSVSRSAQDAKKKLWLREGDGISMNIERVLSDAKSKALELSEGYEPPQPRTYRMPGEGGRVALDSAVEEFAAQGVLTTHDILVASAGARAMTGGDAKNHTDMLTESDMAQAVRESFMSLVHTKGTKNRVAHMVKTNQVLREDTMATTENLSALRKAFDHVRLRKRDLGTEPLSGFDAVKLKAMAGAATVMNAAIKLVR